MKVQVTKSLALNRDEAGALVFTKGKLLGVIIRIRDGIEITVGRDAVKADVVVAEKTISRLHCKVIYHRDIHSYSVFDYSKNGVFLRDGSRLPFEQEVIIASGEELWLGSADNIIRLG